MKKILLIVLVFVATAGVAYAVISRSEAKAEVKKECCVANENCVCTDCTCSTEGECVCVDSCCTADSVKCEAEAACCQSPAATEVKE